MSELTISEIQTGLNAAVEFAQNNQDGKIAEYIPELAAFPIEYTSLAVRLHDGTLLTAGDDAEMLMTLQSVAKVVLLIGMVEQYNAEQVFSWVRMEPSGDDFASVARLDQFGPVPYNPMLNAGAISLCSHIPGENMEEQMHWLEEWMQKCFGEALKINNKVFASERRTGDRNRSLAYLMKSNGIVEGDVENILEAYFYCCSFEVNVQQATMLSWLLAHKGKSLSGEQVFSEATARLVTSIMATCGLYNESGRHLVRTGMPAKSSVSGLIVATVPNKVGIAVASPRVNRKGNSIRGEMVLEYLSNHFDWHFLA